MKKVRKRIVSLVMLAVLCIAGSAWADGDPGTVYRVVSKKARVYGLGDTGYLIEDYHLYFIPEATVEQAESFNQVMAGFPDVRTYVYLVNSSRTIDFDHMDRVPPLEAVLRERYPNSAVDCLQIGTFDDYCRYFYKTDHHWNYKGSYQGYTQIIRMMLGEDEPLLEPVETVEFPVMYNGSLNKLMQRTDSDEPFTVYRFDFPPMTVSINGAKKAAYGKQDAYFKGKYNRTAPLTNHYGEFYGGDKALVAFSTGDESKENIIVFSNSFSNAVDMLIASHFQNTYFVDLRHYYEVYERLFSLSNAIRDWKITKVLMLGDGYFFKSGAHYR